MLKVCPQCHNDFRSYHRPAIFCGRDCHSASMKNRPTFQCGHCGNSFERPRHLIKKKATERFCSSACHFDAKRDRARTATCVQCQTVFHPAGPEVRHCSRKCRNAGLVTAVTLTYETCCAEYRAFASEAARGRRFCSHECAENAMIGSGHPNYAGGRWLKHGRRWQRVRMAVIERDKCCRLCAAESSGGGRSLHVHHIHARRDYLIVDIANELDNLAALCAACHTYVEMAIKHGRTALIPMWLRPKR